MPIRDENLPFSPNVNAFELGTSFVLTSTRQVRDARFYTNELQAPAEQFQTALVNIYPYGLEDLTGPIRQVIIPCNAGAITGTGTSLVGGATAAECVANPGDSKWVQYAYNNGAGVMDSSYWFNISQYPVLANKRILNVSLLYSGTIVDLDPVSGDNIPFINPFPAFSISIVRQRADILANYAEFTGPSWFSTAGTLWQLATIPQLATRSQAQNQVIGALDIGDINNFWDPTVNPINSANVDRMPWRYVDMLRLDPTFPNVTRQHIGIRVNPPTTAYAAANPSNSIPRLALEYLALRVIYCEERRLIYGAKRIVRYNRGVNVITMRDQLFQTDPVLTAGTYLPTLSFVSPGEVDYGQSSNGEFPQFNGLRELYQIPSHVGTEVDIPFPLAEHLEETFSRIDTHILPQLTLHASGGTLTEPHVYGRQAAAQVYGVNTAEQLIYDDISGSAANYPQVRYYARRFGDTTIPLTLTGVGSLSGSTVSISVADFDDLAEIIDGWKEVTLRFSTVPSMGAVAAFPAWIWSATGETAGNRWEILAAAAPALSGIPGNYYNTVATSQQLGVATYQPPTGTGIWLSWMPQGVASPWVTGASIDTATDAVLIFSQDPATVTGVGLTNLTQMVSGVGLECGSLPCCIPSGIGYLGVAWSPNAIAGWGYAIDNFDVDGTNGWPNMDTGQPWNILAGAAGDFSVAGGVGKMSISAAGTFKNIQVGSDSRADSDVYVSFTAPEVPVGDTFSFVVNMRFVSDYLRATVSYTTSNTVTVSIEQNVSAVSTVFSTAILPDITATIPLRMRVQAQGTLFRAKVWAVGEDEPDAWSVTGNTTYLTAGVTTLLWGLGGAVANTLPLVFTVDDFMSSPLPAMFGGYELQRWDAEQDDFETIMLASDPFLTSFNDYEARVGIDSAYRIRALNVLNFAGLWSSYVTGAPPSPGVTAGGACGDNEGALIFTSNADQTGANNAAYVMQWPGTPDEDFQLPEADMVTFQPMYGRDGAVAFHGTERGLERFTRTVLLHAAAIDPIRLADATTIRDLAWADLPYVCVRDHRGDRWFSSVAVPRVSSRLNATRYMARLEITETTRTPYPVDP